MTILVTKSKIFCIFVLEKANAGLRAMKTSAEILRTKELGDYIGGGYCTSTNGSLYSQLMHRYSFIFHSHAAKHMLSVSDALCCRVSKKQLLRTI